MPVPGAIHELLLNENQTRSAYSRWAPIYDLIFDWPFHPGRLAAARAASKAAGDNGELLVVGVGTGLELGLLDKSLRVTGIDLSPSMLERARARVNRKGLGQVKALLPMDARRLEFAPASFDAVLAPYVLSVVPEPNKVLDEMWRVLRPGGQMIVMNHFAAERRGPRAAVEAALEKSSAWLGWHPNFPMAIFTDWRAAQADADALEIRALAPLRLFTLLRVGKRG